MSSSARKKGAGAVRDCGMLRDPAKGRFGPLRVSTWTERGYPKGGFIKDRVVKTDARTTKSLP